MIYLSKLELHGNKRSLYCSLYSPYPTKKAENEIKSTTHWARINAICIQCPIANERAQAAHVTNNERDFWPGTPWYNRGPHDLQVRNLLLSYLISRAMRQSTYTCSKNNCLNCITFVFRNSHYIFCNPCLKLYAIFVVFFALRDVQLQVEWSAIKCFLKWIKLTFREIRNDSLSHV